MYLMHILYFKCNSWGELLHCLMTDKAGEHEAMKGVTQPSPDVMPMRHDERIDPEKVGNVLAGKIAGTVGTPQIFQFGGGKANLTYLLRWEGNKDSQIQEWVLRRPPLGPVAPKSHDMKREYQVLRQLYQAYPFAPQAVFFSEDPEVVGAPFLIMERRTGVVVRQTMPAKWKNNPTAAKALAQGLVDAMALLHQVKPADVGLDTLGRPEGFMQRQLRGWAGRWSLAQGENVDTTPFEDVHAWLVRRMPPAQRNALVHNDFKLDNVMMHPTILGQVSAVFDWDMCTLGDPLADLGGLLGYWTEVDDSPERRSFSVMPSEEPGYLTRQQAALRYGKKTGLNVDDAEVYEVFGLWRTAVIIQQIYARWSRGQTQDERFESYGNRAKMLVQAAKQRMEAISR